MSCVLLRDLEAGVLTLTFNRPERHNAWTIELEEAYFDALIEAAADRRVRVIVVTGAGRSFCPGLDVEVLAAATTGNRNAYRPTRPTTFARSIPKPVIAAINGGCIGVGFVLACSADIRFAARGAKLSTGFARRGLAAENATSWLLPRLIGTGPAMDLLLSSRVVLAEEALSLGLVNRVCEPDRLLAETLGYALDLADHCSPRSMATIKEQVHGDWERTLEESRISAWKLVKQHQTLSDFAEGVRSYQQKRPPRFEGLSAGVRDATP